MHRNQDIVQFLFNLLLCKRKMGILKRRFSVNFLINIRDLTWGIIITVNKDILLIKHYEITSVSADCKACVEMNKPMDWLCTLSACSNSVNSKARARVNVSADENILLLCLISKTVRLRSVTSAKFYCLTVDKITPFNWLTDWKINTVTFNCFGIIFVILRLNLPLASLTLVHF